MNITEAIQQMREGKKVCRSSECDGYCYFILGYEDNEYEERREIIFLLHKMEIEYILMLNHLSRANM